MNFDTILLEKENHIATLTFNRPDKANSINQHMTMEINTALEDVANDADLRVLILTGAGDKAFSGGGDIADEQLYATWDAERMRKWMREAVQGVSEKLFNMPIPTIASVNGVAAGGGFDWPCACDIRIGCEKTRFLSAQIKTGVVPDAGACYFLPRLVGLSNTLEILYTADWVTAEKALEIGLLTKLVSSADLRAETKALAEKIAKAPPIVTRLVKQVVHAGLNTDLATNLDFTATAAAMTIFTKDHEEGVAAWLEKRDPVYKGH
ncbi:MAG: enoyl-CoA hydratase/isomerase family protein [Chloroflexota bacterium]|nr:enoyl-CoA hydratase/isomerase family protein [Chloroflexota bacterium]